MVGRLDRLDASNLCVSGVAPTKRTIYNKIPLISIARIGKQTFPDNDRLDVQPSNLVQPDFERNFQWTAKI